MVCQGHVLVALGGGGFHHQLNGIVAVRPFAVQVQVAFQVSSNHQLWQHALQSRVHLIEASAQLRRHPGQAQPSVEGLFVGKLLHLSGLGVGDAVLI